MRLALGIRESRIAGGPGDGVTAARPGPADSVANQNIDGARRERIAAAQVAQTVPVAF
jgi:hypothetical protein